MSDNAGPPPQPALRSDLKLIADMIAPGSRMLDIGCGDGALLHHLVRDMGIDGRGIELSQAGVHACVSHGLSVIQGDADTDLKNYPSGAFDYVVLSETLQATRDPLGVVEQMVRIGRHAIVSFTNFGHWRRRWRFLWSGRVPVSYDGSHAWYDTPNIRFCSVRDFLAMCDELGLTVLRSLSVDRRGIARELNSAGLFANLTGEHGLFLLTKN